MENNLENIKVGDSVAFCTGGVYGATWISKVTKVTATQFEAGPNRFRKKDGVKVGNKYIKCRLATEKDIEHFKIEQRRSSLRTKLMDFFAYYDKVDSLTLDEMEKIVDVLKAKF